MDLRYLHFLLSACSWLTVIFCVIMLLWIVLNDVSEISLGPVKLKLVFAIRSLGLLLVLMFGYCEIMGDLEDKIAAELEKQGVLYVEHSEHADDKKTLTGFYDTITHDLNTAAFAFLTTEADENNRVFNIRPSIVQYYIKYILYILPVIFVFVEFYRLGFLSSFEPIAAMCLFASLCVWLKWYFVISQGLDSMKDVILEIVRLGR